MTDKTPNQSAITREPIEGSKKVYVKGEIYDIEVAMREIGLTDTKALFTGKVEKILL